LKIYVASDHNGFHFREKLVEYLAKRKVDFVDLGNKELEKADDWTYWARLGTLEVLGSDDPDPRGIFLCGSGQGMCIMANRHKGIRAAVCWNKEITALSRNDDDINVLCLPASMLDPKSKEWEVIVDTFIDTPFARLARYVRRNREVDEL